MFMENYMKPNGDKCQLLTTEKSITVNINGGNVKLKRHKSYSV